MLIETCLNLANATRQILKNWKGTLVLGALYAALLASAYLFVTTREASLPQVALTLVLGLVVPLLFFALQAIGANRFVEPSNATRKYLTDICKVAVISVPVILAGTISFYLLGKAENQFAPPTQTTATQVNHGYANADSEVTPKPLAPVQWRLAVVSSIRYLIFLLLLPLVLIHLWISTVQQGLSQALSRVKEHLQQACSPSAVLIYMCGFLIFAVVPYLLLFKNISTERAWLDFSFFAARLALVFTLTLFGWLVTMRALALLQQKPRQVVSHEEL